jgi:hypothetical protein
VVVPEPLAVIDVGETDAVYVMSRAQGRVLVPAWWTRAWEKPRHLRNGSAGRCSIWPPTRAGDQQHIRGLQSAETRSNARYPFSRWIG